MKALIFDSGTIINLSMNGLLYLLEGMKKNFDGKFLITKDVKSEIVDRPMNIDRFELGALRVQKMIDAGILESPSSMDVDEKEIEERTRSLTDMANHFMQVNGKWIEIVSNAEISCLALSDILSKRGVENIIAIDERTMRTLCEEPATLEDIMSARLHTKVDMIAEDFSIFSKYRFIRSSEMVYVAYKKGLVHLNGPKVLEALLFATKFKGCAISFDEINVLKKL